MKTYTAHEETKTKAQEKALIEFKSAKNMGFGVTKFGVFKNLKAGARFIGYLEFESEDAYSEYCKYYSEF